VLVRHTIPECLIIGTEGEKEGKKESNEAGHCGLLSTSSCVNVLLKRGKKKRHSVTQTDDCSSTRLKDRRKDSS